MFILLPETLTLDYLTNEEEGQYLDRKRIRFVRQFRGLMLIAKLFEYEN